MEVALSPSFSRCSVSNDSPIAAASGFAPPLLDLHGADTTALALGLGGLLLVIVKLRRRRAP